MVRKVTMWMTRCKIQIKTPFLVLYIPKMEPYIDYRTYQAHYISNMEPDREYNPYLVSTIWAIGPTLTRWKRTPKVAV